MKFIKKLKNFKNLKILKILKNLIMRIIDILRNINFLECCFPIYCILIYCICIYIICNLRASIFDINLSRCYYRYRKVKEFFALSLSSAFVVYGSPRLSCTIFIHFVIILA